MVKSRAAARDVMRSALASMSGLVPCPADSARRFTVGLGDVLLEAALALRVGTLLQELDHHLDARERRAQLVRRRGEQELVRAHQPLDALGCLVEALGEARDLVAALDL